MNWLAETSRVRRLLVILLIGAASGVMAGEAIVIPSEKSRQAPSPADTSAARDLFRAREKMPSSSPFDVLNVPVVPRVPLDPKEEKRQRLRRLEKENWMVIDRGELEAEEDEKDFLGIGDSDLDEDQKSGNLMFRDFDKEEKRRNPANRYSLTETRRQPGERPSKPTQQAQPASEEEKSSLFRENNARFGPHIAGELNLRSAFETRAASDSLSPHFNKSDLTLHGLLNAGNTVEAREQQVRREEFRKFLDNPIGSTPLSGPSDPVNLRGDLTRQPLNPTIPQSAFGSDPGRQASAFTHAPSFSRSSSSTLGSAGPSFNTPRPAAGFSAGQFMSPQDARSKAPMTFEPPRRKF